MKLSEAMRLGAMLKPQSYEYLRDDGKTCALGAACDAVGIAHDDPLFATHALGVEFPAMHSAVNCPACGAIRGAWRRFRNEEFDLEDVIIHLNDDHHWKRERIADWVATVEPSEIPDVTHQHEPSDAVATSVGNGNASTFALLSLRQ